MVKTRNLWPKPLLDEDAIFEAFNDAGIKHSHASNLWRHVIQNGLTQDFHTIPDFPKKAAVIVSEQFQITTSRVVDRKDASDGSTTKLVIELQDGRQIESVIMRYGEVELRSFPEEERAKRKILADLNPIAAADDTESIRSGSTAAVAQRKFKSNKRATLCVSSQVGCAMGCKFCATGTMGLLDSLTAGEILEQVYHANKIEKIRNIVFMGMGEPLDNYGAVSTAIRAMVDNSRFGLSPGRISVSTVGVVPSMLKMIVDMPNICMALSLHAPDQETRVKIVPTAKTWPIDQIMDAADAFVENQNNYLLGSGINRDLRRTPNVPDENSNRKENRRRHVLLEYVLLGPDVNCSPELAHRLGKLLSISEERLNNYKLNIIPYNPTDAGVPHGYMPPTAKVITEFVRIVRSYGVTVMIRQELGQDIDSACGQLVINSIAKKSSKAAAGCDSATGESVDIEDLTGGRKVSAARSRLRQFSRQKIVENELSVKPAVKAGNATMTSGVSKLMIFAFVLMIVRMTWMLYANWNSFSVKERYS